MQINDAVDEKCWTIQIIHVSQQESVCHLSSTIESSSTVSATSELEPHGFLDRLGPSGPTIAEQP